MTAFGYIWWGLMFLLGFTLWYVIKSESDPKDAPKGGPKDAPSGGNKDE